MTSGLRVISGKLTPAVSTNGGCSQIRISNCYYYNTGDDAIAFNAPEGYAGGSITDALVKNRNIDICATLFRFYTYNNDLTAGSTIQNVGLLNIKGPAVTYGFRWG